MFEDGERENMSKGGREGDRRKELRAIDMVRRRWWADLHCVEVREVGEEGKLVVAVVVISREGDLLVDKVEAIVCGEALKFTVIISQHLRERGGWVELAFSLSLSHDP